MSARRDRVLAVLTDPDELATLTHTLRATGHTVFSASTFSRARKQLSTGSPDFLISDVRLREFNGLHLLISSRRDKLRGAIVLDTEPDPTLADEATRLGALYLVKPVQASELCLRVSKILQPRDRAPRPVMAGTRSFVALTAQPRVATSGGPLLEP